MQAKQAAKELLAFGFHGLGLNAFASIVTRQNWCILTYHRVIEPGEAESPLQPGMFVRPETFERHCRFIAKYANPMQLEDLVRSLSTNTPIPKRTVVVTFDDGWRDNYLNALPALRSASIPATVFLATSYIGTDRAFWTDQLAVSMRVLWRKMRARGSGGTAPFALLETTSDDISRTIGKALREPDSAQFTSDLDALIELLKRQDPAKRERITLMLQERAEEEGEPPLRRQFMNWQEVEEMERAGVAFGSHTHAHLPLTELSFREIVDDLNRAKTLLKEHLQSSSSVLCYPGGYIDDQTQAAAAECGYRFALSTSRTSDLAARPALLGRTGIHEDVSRTDALLSSRIWAGKLF